MFLEGRLATSNINVNNLDLSCIPAQVENKKRQLEDDVDTLQDEVTKLKAVSDMHHTANKELEAKEAELQNSLTSQMAQHRESHQKQASSVI